MRAVVFTAMAVFAGVGHPSLLAQTQTDDLGRRSALSAFTDAAPVVDGLLDEDAWLSAPALGG